MFRKVALGLVGVAAFVASLVLIRQQRTELEGRKVPPGETVPGEIQLDKLRELGI